MAEDREVDALRARIAELEGREPSPAAEGHHRRGLSTVAAVLVVLACVLAPLSVVAVWANREISDTDQYVATVSPLIDSAAVRASVANEVTAAVLDNLDVDRLTSQTLKAIADQPKVPPAVAAAIPGLQGTVVNAIDNFVRQQVDAVLASPQFATVWDQVNRVAHQQVLRLLEGQQGNLVTAQGDTVTLNLAPVVAAVRTRLVDRGFGLAQNIPTVNKSFVLMQSSSVTKAQWAYKALDKLGTWLPVIAVVMLAGGVGLARDRRRTLVRGSLGVVASMLVLGILLALARAWYVNQTPGNVLSPAAAGDVFDTLVRFLRNGLRATGVLFLVIAVAAFLSGPSTAAVRTRDGFNRAVGSLRGSAEAAGWQTGRVGTFTWTHRRALRWVLAGLGALVIVLWNQPSAWDVLLVAVLVVVGLAIVEFLARPAGVRVPKGAPSATAPTGGSAATATTTPPSAARPQAGQQQGGEQQGGQQAGGQQAETGQRSGAGQPRS